ncbi:molybdopterin converting factor subunit 1 [Aquifex sp.]
MIKVRYFSLVKERLGKEEESLDFAGTVRELKEYLAKKYPHLTDIWESVRFAVNEEYVDDDYKLSDNDRVAVIPPVSGG